VTSWPLTQRAALPVARARLDLQPAHPWAAPAVPGVPPYSGAFDLVLPHLTIPDDAAVGALPIQAYAREATLLHLEDGVFTELAAFPFGTSAA
jgi:hypothetical protein